MSGLTRDTRMHTQKQYMFEISTPRSHVLLNYVEYSDPARQDESYAVIAKATTLAQS